MRWFSKDEGGIEETAVMTAKRAEQERRSWQQKSAGIKAIEDELNKIYKSFPTPTRPKAPLPAWVGGGTQTQAPGKSPSQINPTKNYDERIKELLARIESQEDKITALLERLELLEDELHANQ